MFETRLLPGCDYLQIVRALVPSVASLYADQSSSRAPAYSACCCGSERENVMWTAPASRLVVAHIGTPGIAIRDRLRVLLPTDLEKFARCPAVNQQAGPRALVCRNYCFCIGPTVFF